MSDRPFREMRDGLGMNSMIVVSLLFRVVFCPLLFSPFFPSPKLTFGPVYTVSLVSLSRNVLDDRNASVAAKEIMAVDRGAETVFKKRPEPSQPYQFLSAVWRP